MKHHLTTIYCDADDNSHEIVVHFTYFPGCRGARDSLGGKRGAGPPLEPDEDPEIEINKVIDKTTGEEVELDESQLDCINQECWEHLIEMRQQDPPEREPDWDKRPEPEDL